MKSWQRNAMGGQTESVSTRAKTTDYRLNSGEGRTVAKENVVKSAAAATPKGAAVTASNPAKPALSHRPLKGVLTRRMREAHARKVLLFLSTGNTCRSPMAAGYFKKLLEERKIRNIEVRSAGVMTIAGLLATDESKLMLEPYGIILDKHRSQPLTEEMLRRADLVLGMTPFHVQMALRVSPAARGKTVLLKEYTQTDPKNRPIPDPMGCTLEVYKRCFRQIKLACDKLIENRFVTGRASKLTRPPAVKPPLAHPTLSKLRARRSEHPAPVAAGKAGGSASRPSGGRKTAGAPPATTSSAKARRPVSK
jgi:protein-tyrosine phosphatase